jgi:hypothetical protein
MGASSSQPSTSAPQRSRRSRFPTLSSTGRYAVLTTPAGGIVHLLGYYPCSTVSEEEAADLVSAVAPGAVYVDMHPELVRSLQSDVAAGRTSADGRAWRVSEKSRPFEYIAGAGFIISMQIRNMLADNEMLALLGAEAFGAVKAALAAARALPASASPRVVPFPYEMSYNNGITFTRPLDLGALLLGDSSVGSTCVTAVVGNPNAWQYVSEAHPEKNVPAVEQMICLPPSGYFTRDNVAATRTSFCAAVNAVALKATADNSDIDKDMQDREAESLAKGDTVSAALLSERAMLAQSMASAVVWTLQAEADAEVAAAATGGVVKPRPVVALVSLGSVGSLRRNWVNPVQPEVAIPPFTTMQVAVGYIVPAVVVTPVCYGIYRAARRFPRTTASFGVIAASTVGAVVYTTFYGDWARYGSSIREKIATPRITSSLARMNR